MYYYCNLFNDFEHQYSTRQIHHTRIDHWLSFGYFGFFKKDKEGNVKFQQRWAAIVAKEITEKEFLKEPLDIETVTQEIIRFAKKHKELSASQVKIAFYKFRDESMNNKQHFTGKWTEKENEELLKAVKNRGNTTITAVFVEHANKTGRPVKNIAQHYYTALKSDSTEKNKYEVFEKLPVEVLNSLTEFLNSIYVTKKI